MSQGEKTTNPAALFLAAWLVPGMAHWLLGRPAKAVLFFVLIMGTFVTGMAMGDFRNVYYTSGRWTALTQFPAGIVSYVGVKLHDRAEARDEAKLNRLSGPEPDYAREERPVFKAGTLYTAVAGLLNIIVLMDAMHLGWIRRGGRR